MSEELDGRYRDETLFGFQVEVIPLNTRKDLRDQLVVFLLSGRMNQDVVEIHGDLTGIEELCQDVSHDGLEGSGGSCYAEGHNSPFEIFLPGKQTRRIGDVTRFHSDVVEPVAEVYFRQDRELGDVTEGLSDAGENGGD